MARDTRFSETLVGRRLRALERSLPGARDGDPGRVHGARVATRRLREALPVAIPGARRRKPDRTVRRLTRALGPVRDLDVALQMLDDLSKAEDVPRAALTRMTQVIRQERRKEYAQLRRVLGRIDSDKLRRSLTRASRAKKGVARREPDPARLADAGARAARRAAALREAIESAGGVYLPDRLHRVRISVKKLRYALEVRRELSRARSWRRLSTLRAAQDLLGRMQDFEVLIRRVRTVQGAPAAPNFRLSADLDRLVRHLETECRQIHGAYMAARRKILEICDEVMDTEAAGEGRRTKGRGHAAA